MNDVIWAWSWKRQRDRESLSLRVRYPLVLLTYTNLLSLSLSIVVFVVFFHWNYFVWALQTCSDDKILKLIVLHNRRQTLLSFTLQLWMPLLYINEIFMQCCNCTTLFCGHFFSLAGSTSSKAHNRFLFSVFFNMQQNKVCEIQCSQSPYTKSKQEKFMVARQQILYSRQMIRSATYFAVRTNTFFWSNIRQNAFF